MQSAPIFRAWIACTAVAMWPVALHAADPIKPAIQPITIQPVVKAPVAPSKAEPLPAAIARPVVVQPVSPVTVQPIRTARPEAPAASKLPTIPITDLKPLPAVDPSLNGGLVDVRKQAARDAREDRRLGDRAKELDLAAKGSKLGRDNQSIQDGMQESREKASSLMDGADAGLATGIVGGTSQIGGGMVGKDDKAASGEEMREAARRQRPRDPGQKPRKLPAGDVEGADIETLATKTLLENDRDARADLKQQVQEAKDSNARKAALRRAHDSRDGDGGKQDKAGKTVAVVPAKPAGVTKPSLTSRPCTPISPC